MADARRNGIASALVALVDLASERIPALWFAWQRLFEHLDDVAGRKQCEARVVSSALLGDEQHRQHHRFDDMMLISLCH